LDFRDYQVLFLVVVAVSALLVASPALSRLLVWPRTEFFTELWILGPNHMAEDYPYNVSRYENYSIYLGLGNHLGYCAYYLVEVKFRNESQPEPISFGPIENRTPSSLPSLFNITAFVADQQVWEKQLSFSFDYGYKPLLSGIDYRNMEFNGVTLSLDQYSSAWNSTRSEFPGELLFEAWIYNTTLGNFQYHQRFVSLHLNMTG
jgi:hypothetical protein